MDVALDYNQKVSLVRFLDKAVVPTRFTIRADVLPLDGVTDLDIDISLAKIKFWFETIVSRSIVFCRSNLVALDMLLDADGKARVTNHLMICPEEPHDDHLAALMQSKMTALSKGRIAFGCIRIRNDTPSGLVFTYVGDSSEDLPEMKEWFATEPYYFTEPWWVRDDASTLDLVPAGKDIDFDKCPPWAFSLSFIEDAVRPREPAMEDELDVNRNEGLGGFRPKVIDGGRTDER